MEKKLSDYLHLYLGSRVRSKSMGAICDFKVITEKTYELFSPTGDFELLLRKLSDMTEEEAKELWRLHMHIYGNSDLEGIVLCASAITNYLRSIHVDCDSLIESGLAISSK